MATISFMMAYDITQNVDLVTVHKFVRRLELQLRSFMVVPLKVFHIFFRGRIILGAPVVVHIFMDLKQ